MLRAVVSRSVACALTAALCWIGSQALVEVADRLRSLGYQVFVVPEQATIFHIAGVHYPAGQSDAATITWEASRVLSQIAMEDAFARVALSSGKPTVILCDRGTMVPAPHHHTTTPHHTGTTKPSTRHSTAQHTCRTCTPQHRPIPRSSSRPSPFLCPIPRLYSRSLPFSLSAFSCVCLRFPLPPELSADVACLLCACVQDTKAYMAEDKWQLMLDEMKWNVVALRDR